jgi:hypothetical protein
LYRNRKARNLNNWPSFQQKKVFIEEKQWKNCGNFVSKKFTALLPET